ncbi:COMM domain-containing protein 9 [Corythoichthys intestinalis]|uniref:COMM domain-containing protein 9 n=1 Tax=Corythoichthys intestinalis TaxID=161448 RepID=UPI0025A58795|nr:COMM domain-containing protein 9 [Corythoichthys intestinalis]XP_061813287.1 COMM domain-containing protein 9-like [Nerophis lumbriciformis]
MAATLSSEHFDNLQLLLKAPSKELVKDLCAQSYEDPSAELTRKASAALAVPEAQAAELLRSLRALSAHVVFHNLNSPAHVVQIFPDNFHASLKNLLAKILLENSAAWKAEAVKRQASLPQLKSVEWRVDMASGSDALRRMCVPTCLLRLQTEDAREDSVSVATVELSRESLDTMLDGLGRIRDQLSAVAGK